MRSLWWLVALSILVTGGTAAYMIHLVLEARGIERLGDGHDPRTYGFDFDTLLIDEADLIGSHLARDGLDVLDLPQRYDAEEATGYRGRDKYVVSGDLVVGVSVGNEQIAYPLQILNWHEVVNDTLAGIPIVVSYSPLAGLAAAFDRRVDGETLTFGLSGLLYNNHHLLYDRAIESPPGTRSGSPESGPEGATLESKESLWSPLLGKAISGPAAARSKTLRPLSVQLVPWKAWVAQHPRTRVLARDDRKIMAYRRSPFSTYHGNDILRFPAEPLPDPTERPYKTRCIAVETSAAASGSEWVIFDLEEVRASADTRGSWSTNLGGVPLRFQVFGEEHVSAWVERADRGPLVSRPVFWFAWYACRPDDPIL